MYILVGYGIFFLAKQYSIRLRLEEYCSPRVDKSSYPTRTMQYFGIQLQNGENHFCFGHTVYSVPRSEASRGEQIWCSKTVTTTYDYLKRSVDTTYNENKRILGLVSMTLTFLMHPGSTPHFKNKAPHRDLAWKKSLPCSSIFLIQVLCSL